MLQLSDDWFNSCSFNMLAELYFNNIFIKFGYKDYCIFILFYFFIPSVYKHFFWLLVLF